METSPRRVERRKRGRNGEGMKDTEDEEGENGRLSLALEPDTSARAVLMLTPNISTTSPDEFYATLH